MDQLCSDFMSVEAVYVDGSEGGKHSEDCRSTSTIGSRGYGGGGRSFSIERLWDVLDPAAAIF